MGYIGYSAMVRVKMELFENSIIATDDRGYTIEGGEADQYTSEVIQAAIDYLA